MPLPKHIDEGAVVEAIDYQKDVDGWVAYSCCQWCAKLNFRALYSFHAVNIGNMTKRAGQPQFIPCTPRGIIELLKHSVKDIAGKRATVLGRSDIVVSVIEKR
jgi:methylenetetrahydrofolate dehydrogenase (NADP+)/methenyltetrahydrofolate cyclohydrolase/formyltetrahydrofolate synthetase